MSTPNVIVFLTDQQRWDTTGSHGNPLGLTPHFDRLAASGTLLENTFTVQPVCGPSRACMQTSQYATLRPRSEFLKMEFPYLKTYLRWRKRLKTMATKQATLVSGT